MKLKIWGPVIIGFLSIVLCIRQVGEPDVWWQVRTGEYILEHSEVPKVDVFSYTYEGDPWFNVKWGTEVIMALFVKWLGPEFLMLLQWMCLGGILILLYGTYRQLGLSIYGEKKEAGLGFYLALLIFLIGMAFRLNARPEMMSHLFTAAYLFLFLHFYNHRNRLLLLLIPLQLIWANLHEAYGVGLVLIIVFNAVGWFKRYYFKEKARLEIKNLTFLGIVSIIAILSVMLHPMGADMLTQPLDIFGQLGENKFTTELWSFKKEQYWNLPAYTALLVLLVLLYLGFRKKSGERALFQLPMFYSVILLAFLYLASSANRNLPFFFLVATPLLALYLQKLIPETKVLKWSFVFIGVALYPYIASGKFYDRFLEMEKYGLRVDMQSTPIGAARFIEENNIGGKGYVDYFSSSFLLWYLQPDYKSYLDLRDLDVFEARFISNNFLTYSRPETPTKSGKPIFRFMEDIDSFNYVLMENNIQFANFHKYMHRAEDYHLAYATPLTSVYLKENEENRELLNKLASQKLSEKFHPYGELEPAPAAKAISKLFWPWYQPLAPDDSLARYLDIYKRQYR